MLKPSLFQRKLLKYHVAVGFGFVVYATLLQVTKVYSPLWYITGIPMPTTGVTRAWIQALQGNWSAAFAYNRMFLLAPVLAISIYRYLLFKKRNDFIIAVIVAGLFLLRYV